MSHDAYELIAQAARYWFAGLMLIIALRAARITLVDSRRAARLRRLSPMTGLSGELVVLEGDERARRGMRYPVIREGMIGSSANADVRIRHSSVRRRHAYFQLTENGLYLRGHAGARLRTADGQLVRELTLGDGGDVGIGRIHLLLVLSEATAAQEVRVVPRRQSADDELFGAGIDGLGEDAPEGAAADPFDALDAGDFDAPDREAAAQRARREGFARMHREVDVSAKPRAGAGRRARPDGDRQGRTGGRLPDDDPFDRF